VGEDARTPSTFEPRLRSVSFGRRRAARKCKEHGCSGSHRVARLLQASGTQNIRRLVRRRPHDKLAADLVAFLQEHDGHWKGSATELHKQLLSSVKPDSPDVLSRKIGEIAARTPTLTVKHGWEGKNRALTLTLDNGVGSVGGVGSNDDCACGGRGCLVCLTQELPLFEAN
jgi:hypothetical protein